MRLFEQGKIDDVEPTEESVDDRPQNRVVYWVRSLDLENAFCSRLSAPGDIDATRYCVQMLMLTFPSAPVFTHRGSATRHGAAHPRSAPPVL